MSKIDYQALRAKAEKATCGEWSLEYGEGRFDGDDALIHREAAGYIPICRIEGAHPESGFDEDFQIEQQANAEFIAAANPATVLALLDELERNQQYIKRRDQENEDIALTVGRLRVELEGKDSKIANLTAERDALREGEMGDARHSNTRAAADIYFQLVEECEIPAGGSLVEYVDDMREKLEAAEKRLAELQSKSMRPVAWMRSDDITTFGPIFTKNENYAVEQWGDNAVALYASPVNFKLACFTDERNLKYINERGRETSLIWSERNSENGDVQLFRAAGIRIKGE